MFYYCIYTYTPVDKQGVDREGKALPAYTTGILKGISTLTISSPSLDSNINIFENGNIDVNHDNIEKCSTSRTIQKKKSPSNKSSGGFDNTNNKNPKQYNTRPPNPQSIALADTWRAGGFLYKEEESREILQAQISLPGCPRLLSFPTDKVQRLSSPPTACDAEVGAFNKALMGGLWLDEFKCLLDLHMPSVNLLNACAPVCDPKEGEGVLSLRPRDGFRAAEGYVLLAADYSQIELRIMAHFSRDMGLCDAFKSGVDVFRSLAAQWKGIEEGEITDQQRGEVKQVCYALMYGSGT